MTELEISKALAIAIGWKPEQMRVSGNVLLFSVAGFYWRHFDYRDPAVIWPIAEKFDCFPYRYFGKWYVWWGDECTADTAAQAVALAVIGRKK